MLKRTEKNKKAFSQINNVGKTNNKHLKEEGYAVITIQLILGVPYRNVPDRFPNSGPVPLLKNSNVSSQLLRTYLVRLNRKMLLRELTRVSILGMSYRRITNQKHEYKQCM